MELEALDTAAGGYEEAGASLVAVSPQLEKISRQIVKKYGLTFPVLSDPGNQVAAIFGLKFALRKLRCGLSQPGAFCGLQSR
jgi:peroxiredoxin